MTNPLLQAAERYLELGLCPLPAIRAEKRPIIDWRSHQQSPPTRQQLKEWFARPEATAICLVGGTVSGNLEVIDFDLRAEFYERWTELVREESPGLLERLVIERSQSGGKHVIYRCQEGVDKSLKLAQRELACTDGAPLLYAGKTITPRRRGDQFVATLTFIETKAEGGVFLCYPSPGYDLEQGAFEVIPIITARERDILLAAAKSLNEVIREVVDYTPSGPVGDRPGDDYARRADIRPILLKHGWQPVTRYGTEYWRRPGKDWGWSGEIKNGRFYCYTTNAPPFEEHSSYNFFRVYALLEHGGDFSAAAKAALAQGFGATAGFPSSGRIASHRSKDVPAATKSGSPRRVLDGTDCHRAIDECVAALAQSGRVFRRGTDLCEVCGACPGAAELFISSLEEPRLRDLLSEIVEFGNELPAKAGGVEFKPRHFPRWLLQGILARKEYPEIPNLIDVTDAPALRSDGSLITNPGFDAPSGVFYFPSAPFPELKEDASHSDAIAAKDELLEVVRDFPFASDLGHAAWLAAVLTPFARPAFRGPTPLIAIDAPSRGSGKGKLADTISIIAIGREIARSTWDKEDGANRKLITSILLKGSRIAIIDNVTRIGGASLDAVLTSETWTDRVLGASAMTAELPARTLWITTGNNITYAGDTARRTLPIRLEPATDRPEERVDFMHPRLVEYVQENRPRLVRAALTILRAFFNAGQPNAPLRPWGSYEGWSHLIRNVVCWVGLPDPSEAHRAVVDEADEQLRELESVIEAWEHADPERRGLTVKDCLNLICEGNQKLADLFDAILDEKRNRNSKAIGRKLGSFKGRVASGLRFDVEVVHHTNRFFVTLPKSPISASPTPERGIMGVSESERGFGFSYNPPPQVLGDKELTSNRGIRGIISPEPTRSAGEYARTQYGNGWKEIPLIPKPPFEIGAPSNGFVEEGVI